MSLDNISNQYKILMAYNRGKNEKKSAYRILTDYARVQNVSEAWVYLGLYYMKTERPLGISFFSADRYHKALECLNAACLDDEWRDTANLLILTLLSEGSTRNISKAHTLARNLLKPPFDYDYEQQKTIFGHMMGFVADSVEKDDMLPKIENLDENEKNAFVEMWAQYQNRHRRSGMTPEAEWQMMHKSFAYAHYLSFEHYIESKLLQGYQAAYWAYGFVFLNRCNHLLRPVHKGSEEYNKLESIFMDGLIKKQLGALRAIVELYYQERAVWFFSNETVHQAIDKLKALYPDEYKSMISDFKDDGVRFPY